MHSWRVLLLPFLDCDELYARYDFSQPWNSEDNLKLSKEMPSVYGFHNVPPTEDVYTDFFVVVGEDMMWPGAVGRSQKEVTDDIGSTILIVENFGAKIHWMEPRDLHFDTMSFQMQDPQGLSSRYKNPAVALADGAVLRLEGDTPDFLLRALLTINGGESLETKEQYTTFMEDGRLRQKRGPENTPQP